MKTTQLLMPTLRETPADAEVISHKLLLRGGYIRKLGSGIYNYLPLGLRVLQKIENIVREEMNAVGAQELLMPMVVPAELWQETGRWDVYGKELLRFKDRHENNFCLGPTHEEVITDIARKEIRSYRQLPCSLYQIQTKFRDETRPRFGLMRGREFIMKDCYSFDIDEASAQKTYQVYYQAYRKIFERCGLKFRAVEAVTGAIGGTLSHEFQVLAESGEDEIVSCNTCDYAANIEKAEAKSGEACPRCKKGQMETHRGIEVGQVFYLGTKYSESMKAVYLDSQGKENPMVMGCYGVGISRTAAASVEQNYDDKGIVWPLPLAPFAVTLVNLGVEAPLLETTTRFYDELKRNHIDTLWDNRDERAGVKLNDMDLIGIPYQVIIGSRGLQNGTVEIKDRKTGVKENVAVDQVVNYVTDATKKINVL